MLGRHTGADIATSLTTRWEDKTGRRAACRGGASVGPAKG